MSFSAPPLSRHTHTFPAALLSTPHEKVSFVLDPELRENLWLLQRGTEEGAAHPIHFSLSVRRETYKQLNRFDLILLWKEKYVCVYKALSARCLLLCVLVACVYYFISSALKGSPNQTIDTNKHGNVITVSIVCELPALVY